MRSVIFALATLALVQAAFGMNLNCSAVQQPGASMDYYRPSKTCVDSDANVGACFTAFTKCRENATSCGEVDKCIRFKTVCLNNLGNVSTECATWAEGLNNVELYLAAGGQYNGSALQVACKAAACLWAEEAKQSSVNNGMACPVNPDTVCKGPVEPAKFTLTFGGDWATLLNTKRSEVEAAVVTGLATILGVPEFVIRILSLKSGSLIVEFIVTDPTISGETLNNKLATAAKNPSTITAAFAGLKQVSGIDVTLTKVQVSDPSNTGLTPGPVVTNPVVTGTNAPVTDTNAPATPTPSSGAAFPAVLAAVAAVVAALLL